MKYLFLFLTVLCMLLALAPNVEAEELTVPTVPAEAERLMPDSQSDFGAGLLSMLQKALPDASAATLAQGYITAPGGHRIGVCGEAVIKEGQLTGIRSIRSLCIRVARDFPGLSNGVHFSGQAMLILGAPGWGKTTLLRDLARRLASDITVAVVDERQELFPPGFQEGRRMDILFGCPKRQGIETMLKTMTPDCIAVDEITSQEDCAAVLEAKK